MTRLRTLSEERLASIATMLSGCVERGEMAGFVGLVARLDDVHVTAGGVQDLASGTPMQRETIFRIASMTKPIVAAAATILVEEARVRLDDPVTAGCPN